MLRVPVRGQGLNDQDVKGVAEWEQAGEKLDVAQRCESGVSDEVGPPRSAATVVVGHRDRIAISTYGSIRSVKYGVGGLETATQRRSIEWVVAWWSDPPCELSARRLPWWSSPLHHPPQYSNVLYRCCPTLHRFQP